MSDPLLEAQEVSFRRSMETLRQSYHDNVLEPVLIDMVRRWIDDRWQEGSLPLPPLGWGRYEPWYVGDLV